MARKTKYTPEVVDKLVMAVKLGATHELACAYAGINPDTFYHWMNTKPEFSETIKGAEGAGAVQWLGKIEKAASEGNWQAAAWKLERRYPEKYGRSVQNIDLTSGGKALKAYVGFSPDEWQEEKPDENESK